jgi:hypothetical protein
VLKTLNAATVLAESEGAFITFAASSLLCRVGKVRVLTIRQVLWITK